MKFTVRAKIIQLGVCLIGLLIGGRAWAQSYSHARIVRLSFVEGTVTMQRPDVPDWASAPVNTPIQEGFKLSTAQSSFAEVEFENSSTARLGELSLLEFTQLALSPSGDKINQLTLQQGYGTFNFIPEGQDSYEVKTADATLTPYGKTMFRVDLDAGLTRVEVFKGAVEVSSPYGSGTISKDTTLELKPGADQPYQASRGITKDDWDEWVEQREGAETLLRNKQTPSYYSGDGGSPIYGWNDLWNYGNWSYLPGYGYGWAPIVSAGWVPYGFGSWCWYPGFGYTWISTEPWGWLPYHYGGWSFVPGAGWCWFPDGFASWSPGLVVWYQGPGWVGWAPALPPVRGGQSACGNAKGCTTAVSATSFQNGKPVTPRTVIPVDPSQGRVVASPEIPPSRLAMLPGPPYSQRPTAASAIAFDPVSGRFVNSHSTNAATVASTLRASPGAESNPAAAAKPANSEAAVEANVSQVRQGQAESPTRAGLTARPAPKEPPILGAREEESRRDSSGSWAGRSWSAAPSSGGHSDRGSSVHSAPASSGASRGGGGFSGGGGGSIGGGSGGASSGGHSSGGSRH